MAQLYPMFATNVVVEQMQSNDEYKKEILPDLLKEFKKNPNQKAPWATDCNTWQTAASGKGLDHLNNGLQLAVEDYFNYIGCEPFKYEIRAWFNIHTSDMYQEAHDHVATKEILSGIYYLQFDKEKDQPVVFLKHNEEFYNLLKYTGITTASENPDLNIKEGSLILFPPNTRHYVPRAKEKHDGLRITISFNVHFLEVIKKNGTRNT